MSLNSIKDFPQPKRPYNQRANDIYAAMDAGFSTPSIHIVAEDDSLLTAILLHLPIRSLVRFKSVSKRWFSLITNPYFCRIQSSNVATTGIATGIFVHHCIFSFVALNLETSTIAPTRDLTFANAPITISQSCNGLLCCYALRDFMDFRSKYIYVYNPTTSLYTLIPDPTYRVFKSRSVRSVNLAFDPTKSAFYKVVCVYQSDSVSGDFGDFEDFEIEIYSSETGVWKHAVKPFTASMDFKYGVFWNGAINWPSNEDDSLYFNVEDEELGRLTMPPLPVDRYYRNIVYFGESNGHLHLIEINSAPATQFSVYEMEMDYSGWFVKYHVDLGIVMETFPEAINHSYYPSQLYYHGFGVLAIVRAMNEEETFLVVSILGKAIRYNIVNKTFRKLCDFVPGADNYQDPLISWKNAFQYIESFACV